MRAPAFRPIDQAARTGAMLLLEGVDDTLHSGKWDGERFVYSSGRTIIPRIARYFAWPERAS